MTRLWTVTVKGHGVDSESSCGYKCLDLVRRGQLEHNEQRETEDAWRPVHGVAIIWENSKGAVLLAD